MLWLRVSVLVSAVLCSACVRLESSFYAPLFQPRLLAYRVDASFEPSAARARRDRFANMFGYRGERLIQRLGNGEGPPDTQYTYDENNAIKFYYTT